VIFQTGWGFMCIILYPVIKFHQYYGQKVGYTSFFVFDYVFK
jgi:hypothetical protein